VPDYTEQVYADFHLPTFGVNGDMFYRETGATTTNGYEVLQANSSGRVDHNAMVVSCSSSQAGQIRFSEDSTNTAQVRQLGHILPDYIYTGA
jgi:hypothetical protein